MNDQKINELLDLKIELNKVRQEFLDEAQKFADCRCQTYRMAVELAAQKLMEKSDEYGRKAKAVVSDNDAGAEIARRALAYAESTLSDKDGVSEESYQKLLKLLDGLGTGTDLVLRAKTIEGRWYLD